MARGLARVHGKAQAREEAQASRVFGLAAWPGRPGDVESPERGRDPTLSFACRNSTGTVHQRMVAFHRLGAVSIADKSPRERLQDRERGLRVAPNEVSARVVSGVAAARTENAQVTSMRAASSFTSLAATCAVNPATSCDGLNSTTSAPTTVPPTP